MRARAKKKTCSGRATRLDTQILRLDPFLWAHVLAPKVPPTNPHPHNPCPRTTPSRCGLFPSVVALALGARPFLGTRAHTWPDNALVLAHDRASRKGRAPCARAPTRRSVMREHKRVVRTCASASEPQPWRSALPRRLALHDLSSPALGPFSSAVVTWVWACCSTAAWERARERPSVPTTAARVWSSASARLHLCIRRSSLYRGRRRKKKKETMMSVSSVILYRNRIGGGGIWVLLLE